MQFIFFAPLLALIPFIVWASRIYDRLIEAQYRYHRSAWEQDGESWGIFWTPPDRAWKERPAFPFRPWLAQLKWLWRTPSWIADDYNAKQLLKRYRWTYFMATFVAVPLFGFSEMLLCYFFCN
jgi:hypothetical protein